MNGNSKYLIYNAAKLYSFIFSKFRLLPIFIFVSLFFLSAMAWGRQTQPISISSDLTEVSTRDGDWLVRITPDETLSKRVEIFSRDLKKQKIQGAIKACHEFIDLLVPVKDGDQSHGAFCLLEKKETPKQIAICDDEMVGHFGVQAVSNPDISRRYLIGFIVNNCVGG